jgi:hypothetical protein
MKKFFVKTAPASGLVLALLLSLGACENVAGGGGSSDPALTGTVTLVGLPRVGEILTADAFALDGEGDISYQWLRGDTAIDGVSGITYELTEDDLLYRIKVRVSRAGYSGSVDSNSIGLISADPFTTIEAVSAYLASTSRGTSAENLAYIALDLQLTRANWTALAEVLASTDKLITLDLSACTKGEHISGGGLYDTGIFDANSISAPKVVELVFPDEATTIGPVSVTSSKFTGFTALKEIDGKETIALNPFAFMNIPSLVTASFPKAQTVGNNALRGCSNLSSLDLSSLDTFGTTPLSGCTALTSLTVSPDNPNYSAADGMLLSKDGTGLYAYPSAAGEVTLPETITTVNNHALNGTVKTSLKMPGVTSIGTLSALGVDPNLVRVEAPRFSVIPGSAFSGGTGLAYLDISGVTDIKASSFYNTGADTALTIIMGDVQPTVQNTGSPFYNCGSKTVTVKVPAGAITGDNYNDAWKTAFKGSVTTINLTVEELP